MTPRARTGIKPRKENYGQSLWKQSEDRVWLWLQGQAERTGNTLVDMRDARTYHDFVYAGWTLDVKTDQYALTSGRVAWEQVIFFYGEEAEDVRRVEGWGNDTRLDYIIYVFPAEEEQWPALLVDRSIVDSAIAQRGADTFRQFSTRVAGPEQEAAGLLLDISWLKACGAVVREMRL
jgi:hypothetical protein